MLTENDVVDAVVAYLNRSGWTILAARHGHERGVDIEASRADELLHVEAKGATSSRQGSSNHGRAFTGGEVRINIAEALYTAAIAATARVATCSAIAIPADDRHERYVMPLLPALDALGVALFRVDETGTVHLRAPGPRP